MRSITTTVHHSLFIVALEDSIYKPHNDKYNLQLTTLHPKWIPRKHTPVSMEQTAVLKKHIRDADL